MAHDYAYHESLGSMFHELVAAERRHYWRRAICFVMGGFRYPVRHLVTTLTRDGETLFICERCMRFSHEIVSG